MLILSRFEHDESLSDDGYHFKSPVMKGIKKNQFPSARDALLNDTTHDTQL